MPIDVLYDQTVSFYELANSIEAEILLDSACGSAVESGEGFKCPLCGACSLEKYLNRKCPKFDSSSDSAFPFLDTHQLTNDERLSLHAKLIKDTENINNGFDDLIDQISDSFYEMPEKELQKAATMLSIPNPLPKVDPAGFITRYLKERHHFLTIITYNVQLLSLGVIRTKKNLLLIKQVLRTFAIEVYWKFLKLYLDHLLIMVKCWYLK